MGFFEDVQFNLFIIYFRYKINKFIELNQNSSQIVFFLKNVLQHSNTFTPEKLLMLEKRFQK